MAKSKRLKSKPKTKAKPKIKTAKKVIKKVFPAKELKDFKERLINLKEEVLYQIKDISEDTLMKSQKDISGDISGYSLHMADVASDNYARDFNLSLVSNEHKVLLDIEAACKRIEDKTYGACLNCTKAITKTRLKAIPHARYCTKCQSKLEKENII